tara:strand:+ start:2865 stop:3455 length:591 start_codon:yes stop_codon:yes gene_type:complete
VNRLVTLIVVVVVVGTAAVFLNAEEEAWKSEIATFESVQQDKDYRVTLLGVTKGIAFVDSQKPINDGGRPPGKNAVPWMRVVTVIENLTDKDEPWGFSAETADGKELVGEIKWKTNGRVFESRTSGAIAEMDYNYPPLRFATFPVGMPEVVNEKKSKVYSFTLSGKLPHSETAVLRFSFGDANNRRELVFKGVPLP